MLSPFQKEYLQIGKEHLSLRLDRLLGRTFPEYSRTYFQKLIEEGHVLINGKIPKKRDSLNLNDEVEVAFVHSQEISLQAENIPLSILYEDEHLLIIDKPPGLVVHPAPGHPCGTLVNALLFHFSSFHKMTENTLRPGIVHRLDKGTSGVLLIAKNLMSHAKLSALFSMRTITKKYRAICVGNPGNAKIDAPLKRHSERRKEIAVSNNPAAKPATTLCHTLSFNHGLSDVSLNLMTGRTHQIRVHMKHHGTPILGDPVYGSISCNKKFGASRPMLHAETIVFEHPFLKKTVDVTAPLPQDFLFFKNKIGS
jgi:23S rRNA pseudouridine1911/1915/1917 synthase